METDGIVNEEKTTINNSTTIDGNIKAKEHLVINGTINGNVNIEGHNLFLGPGGKIEGEVRAHNVRVRGHLKGDIVASGKIEIMKEANYSGKIKSKGISVEQGAYFNASVKLGRESSENKSQKDSLTGKAETKKDSSTGKTATELK